MIINVAKMNALENPELPPKSDVAQRERSAESLLAAMFERAGWDVQHPPPREGFQPDLLVRRRGIAYAVEVKAGPEGRSDRLVPLFAQAVLQSARAAAQKAAPLAVVAAQYMFREVMRTYFKEYCSNERLVQRTHQLVDQAKTDGMPEELLPLFATKMDEHLRDYQSVFDWAKERFFLQDLCPEHSARFKVSLAECLNSLLKKS